LGVCLQGAAICATTLVATPVHAEERGPTASDVKRAADEFDRGRESYRGEQYVEAAEHFEAADAHAPSAAALRLAIASRKEAGQLSRAATLAALALSRHGDDAELSELANGVIDEAKTLHRAEITCDEACELAADSKIVHGGQNLSRVLYLEVGAHKITASWPDGRTSTQSVDATEGGTSSLEFQAPAVATPAEQPDTSDVSADLSTGATDPARDKSGGWSPVVFWTGAGLTVAGGVATGILGYVAQTSPGPDTVRKECKGQGTDCPEYQQGLKNQRNANIALAATGVLGVFTAVTGLFLTDWSDSPEAAPESASSEEQAAARSRRNMARAVTVQPYFGFGEGASIGATGTF
jgi:hypothetical protein